MAHMTRVGFLSDITPEDKRSLLDQIEKPGDIRASVAWQKSGGCILAVAALDQRGLLSVIAGLLAAYGISILQGELTTHAAGPAPEPKKTASDPADKTTSQYAPYARPGRKILDIFQVGGEQVNSRSFWENFASELTALMQTLAAGELDQVRQDIIDRVCVTLANRKVPREKLLPVRIEVDNPAAGDHTLLRIRSKDTPGFIFSFANALAMLEINIEKGAILTHGTEVQDDFWILDSQGRKITGQEKIHQLRAACVLIKQFTYMLPLSANPGQALRQFGDLVDQVLSQPDWAANLGSIHSGEVMDNIAAMMGVSQFLWEDFLRMQHENLFPLLSSPEKLEESLSKKELEDKLREELAPFETDDNEEKFKALNGFKDRQMFRIDLRHITQRISDVDFAKELSDLTDVVVGETMKLGFAHLSKRYGEPTCSGTRPCRWAVFCAGKAGGREMGFASDIELLTVYEGAGQTNGRKSLDNAVFYEKLVRFLLKHLRVRQEGIFQIDLQLRPYGNKGPLANSLGAFRDYYSPTGPARQFERLAFVKLRPICGDADFVRVIMACRDAFVYSGQSVDYQNIRYLRQRQVEELVNPKTVNIKLSPGGLVDIEYFIQAKQLEAGADDPGVRVANTMAALQKLGTAGVIPTPQVENIHRAYRFLRRTIDALRVVRGNARDLTVPDSGSPAFSYLTRRLGYKNEEAFIRDLDWSLAIGRSLWASGPAEDSPEASTGPA